MDKIKKIVEWTKIKIRLEKKNKGKIYFHEREIWWVNLGINIGFEQDGKHKNCERPALILKKFNKNLFWILPLSSRSKDNQYYLPFKYQEKGKIKNGIVILSQIRTVSNKRLLRKIGVIPKNEFNIIRNKVKNLI